MNFWTIHNKKNKSADLYIYGYIAQTQQFDEDVTPKQFADELNKLGDIDELRIHINSNGGVVFAAFAIYNILANHPARKIVYIDGIAASAATVIMLAGDRIIMSENAMLMIHNPWTSTSGESSDLRKSADTLDRIRENIIELYQQRTNIKRERLIEMMDNETWLSAEEAVKLGFADEIDKKSPVRVSLQDGQLVVNDVSYDLTLFQTVPSAMLAIANATKVEQPTEQENVPIENGANNIEGVIENMDVENMDELQNQTCEEALVPENASEPNIDGIKSQVEKIERERVAKILAIDAPGCDDIKLEAISNGTSYEETCALILNSGRMQEIVKSFSELNARMTDAGAVNGISADVGDIEDLDDETIIAKMNDKSWWSRHYDAILAKYKTRRSKD